MTCKEQNEILNDKIESNINQYKIDRLNAEISAFSSGDLNKYEFLTRKGLRYKPNALDKARFEFSPLGQTFSTELDKTAQGYQEEGVINLLKDIRDGLVGGIAPRGPGGTGLDDPNNDDPYNDDYDMMIICLIIMMIIMMMIIMMTIMIDQIAQIIMATF